jgi:hypothetical protein
MVRIGTRLAATIRPASAIVMVAEAKNAPPVGEPCSMPTKLGSSIATPTISSSRPTTRRTGRRSISGSCRRYGAGNTIVVEPPLAHAMC